jgi:hypothetical protein
MRPLLFAALFVLTLPTAVETAARDEGRREAIQRQAESSLLVTGTIDITADGQVRGYALDKAETLPPGIVSMAASVVPQWKFEPLSLPEKTVGRTKMSLRFVANRLDNNQIRVELRSASFDAGLPPEQRVTIAKRGRMPMYPRSLGGTEVSGTVYLAVQIGRDGSVMNIDATQVNLNVYGEENDMARWRDELAKASIQAVRTWRFAPPTVGEAVGAPHWVGILPVSYQIMSTRRPRHGQWDTYLPGPRKQIAWLEAARTDDRNDDALPPGEFRGGERQPRLIGWPPGGG